MESDRIAKLDAKLDKVADQVPRQANKEMMRLIMDRVPRITTASVVYQGKVVKTGDGELVVEVPGKGQMTFKLTPNARLSSGEHEIKLRDLKTGTRVLVGQDEKGQVSYVEAGEPASRPPDEHFVPLPFPTPLSNDTPQGVSLPAGCPVTRVGRSVRGHQRARRPWPPDAPR